MEAEFWHKRWQSGRIGFHQGRVNRMLERYHDRLRVTAGARFFLPLGLVDAVFDRAALVALPEELRGRYCAHLSLIIANAPQLLVSFVYDQTAMAGPPFSVSDAEIFRHYGSTHAITLLADVNVEGGLKGICPAREKAWLLMPTQSVSG